MLHINKKAKNKFIYMNLLRIIQASNMFSLGWAAGVFQQSICNAYYNEKTIKTYAEFEKLDNIRVILQEAKYKELENELA